MMGSIFHKLDISERVVEPIKRLNNPFYYTPDELTLKAAEELQKHLPEHPSEGKMWGILVVENDGTIGFLTAYSGQISDEMAAEIGPSWTGCPPIYDYFQPDGYFKTHENEISDINRLIADKESSSDYKASKDELEQLRKEAEEEINRRKKIRNEAKERGNDIREAQFLKAEIHRAKVHYRVLIEAANDKMNSYRDEITALKRKRKLLSDRLQTWLFNQFVLLNARGENKPMPEIFHEYYRSTGSKLINANTPCPSGAGECCEPKLLQYAYSHGMHPLRIAAFWWGPSPKNELRRHGNYYPACSGRCKPILEWMLQGLDVEPNTLHSDVHQPLRIVYEDDYIAVVNKPSGMLSVPGRNHHESVVSELAERWGNSATPLTVHRLDMATSGLMVVAKDKHCQYALQRQFEERKVKKVYVAEVESPKTSPDPSEGGGTEKSKLNPLLAKGEGRINLPLRPDTTDRPRQVVDHDNGKPAITIYKVVETINPKSNKNTSTNQLSFSPPSEGLEEASGEALILLLRPLTGRTHQLRIHCASPEGLDAPIIGDTLYGTPAERLYLHAAYLEFDHPITGKRMHFRQEPDFYCGNAMQEINSLL